MFGEPMSKMYRPRPPRKEFEPAFRTPAEVKVERQRRSARRASIKRQNDRGGL